MTIIGFDVSKDELVGVAINKRGQIKDIYTIANNQAAINKLIISLRNKYPRLKVGSEATGEYHNQLALACLSYNIPYHVLNPIVTKQFTKATVRKRKTDLSDAQIIAKCLLQGEGELATASDFKATKRILRTSAELSRLAVSLSHMERRFTEFFKAETAIQTELKQLQRAVEASRLRIQSLGQQRVDPALLALLGSIPGIGDKLASVIISEVGAVARFNNSKALVAFAGLDPKVRQSGYTLMRNTRLTKRGSPYLRRALYLAASIAQRSDPELKAYYLKKRSEGKRYKEATVANARHILNRVYAVWQRKTPYQRVRHSV